MMVIRMDYSPLEGGYRTISQNLKQLKYIKILIRNISGLRKSLQLPRKILKASFI